MLRLLIAAFGFALFSNNGIFVTEYMNARCMLLVVDVGLVLDVVVVCWFVVGHHTSLCTWITLAGSLMV